MYAGASNTKHNQNKYIQIKGRSFFIESEQKKEEKVLQIDKSCDMHTNNRVPRKRKRKSMMFIRNLQIFYTNNTIHLLYIYLSAINFH